MISDFGVSRLFIEIWCAHSRCSRIASFCRRNLKKNWEYFSGRLLLQKNSKIFGLPFLCGLSCTPVVTGGGVQPKFAFTLNVKFWLYPHPRHHGGSNLNYTRTVNKPNNQFWKMKFQKKFGLFKPKFFELFFFLSNSLPL